jgi:DNA-binding NarL/FixJ family response regulator
MRILIADRNARLLESIVRTFARQFSIQTATSHERCNDLLLRGEFDLVIVSEKLADGRGLRLLGQIARNSPNTLRVFAARRSRLQLLKGKLGPFGLFRTLAYPVGPQELLSTLTLARAGLEVEMPALEATRSVSLAGRQGRELPAARGNAALPLQGQHSGTARPAPAPGRPAVERISLTSTDATFAVNVPKTIASLRRARRSNLSATPRAATAGRLSSVCPFEADSVHTPASGSSAPRHRAPVAQERNVPSELPSDARQSRKAASHVRGAALPSAQAPRPEPQSVLSQAAGGRPASTASLSSPDRGSAHALVRRKAANTAVSHQADSRSFQQWRVHPAPLRTKVVLGATAVLVFLVTTLTLNLFDANVHVTRAAASRPEIEQPAVTVPPQNSPPSGLAPLFRPSPKVAQRVEPKPEAMGPDVRPPAPQIAASTPPVADPSTFSSEAYEPIYSD